MLECSTCLQACFRAVVSTHLNIANRTARRHITASTALLQESGRRKTRREGSSNTNERINHVKPKSIASQKQESRKGLQSSTKSSYQKSPDKKVNVEDKATEQALKYELRFLKDPLKLADHVKYTLASGKEERALALVQLSSRSVANIVAWNHVMDDLLKKGKSAKAMSTFNDMKKRGLQPDSYTYSILLRGLADNAHQPAALGRALSLYHALHAPKSQATPNIIHTNCVLKVCSRAGDVDSMWDIISKLPTKGAHAANARTYVMILNTIRYQALSALGEVPEADRAGIIEDAIIEGRKLWANIVSRWHAADIAMEEQLVSSMGRLLLIGQRPRDWDDVLSLIQQTIGLRRLVPRLGTPGRREQAPYIRNAQSHQREDQHVDVDDPQNLKRRASEFGSSSSAIDPNPEDPFALVPSSPKDGKRQKKGIFVEPSNNILSVVIEACHKMMLKDAGAEYWSLLTDPTVYGLVPDQDNFSTRLRLLRQTRSSAEALAVIRDEMPAAKVQPAPKTYRIVISTCYRDILNPNAFETATGVIDVLMRNISSGREKGFAYPGVLEIYTEITRKFFLEEIRKFETEEKISTSWGQLTRAEDNKAASVAVAAAVKVLTKAITRLEQACKTIRRSLMFGASGSKIEHQHERDQVYKVFRQTASFCGMCIESGILDSTHWSQVKALQAQLDRDMKRLDVRDELQNEKVDQMQWREKRAMAHDN